MKRRTDTNQRKIVDALRKVGAVVHVLSGVGGGVPDLLVGYRGHLFLLEVKNAEHVRRKNGEFTKNALTPDEQKFHQQWAQFPVHIVCSLSEALDAIGVVKRFWDEV